jgi:hypothetical protein
LVLDELVAFAILISQRRLIVSWVIIFIERHVHSFRRSVDNAGAIEIANVPKIRPRTKHLNIKYHHFREEVKKETISIYHTRTEEQIADILNQALT